MLPIGAWIDHPHYGRARIVNHNGTRYIASIPGVGLREFDANEPGVREAPAPPQGDPIRQALREVLDEYGFGAAAPMAGRWEGGELVVRPGKPGLQEHRLPVDQLFHKVVMVRDRLRVLEQKINASERLSDVEKADLQLYITRCYGSLTSLNFLFAREEDKFKGTGGA